MKISGIYQIRCKINNKCYIGSSIDIKKRMGNHKTLLNHNNHTATYMQNSWNKYEQGDFEFNILESNIQKENLIDREKHYCRKFAAKDRALPDFNTAEPGSVTYGKKHTDEFKEAQRKRYLGCKLSTEHKSNIGKGLKEAYQSGDRIVSEKAKKALDRTGKQVSIETRKKQSLAHKGVKLSEAHKASIKRAQAIKPSRAKRPVIGTNKLTGEQKVYDSAKDTCRDGFHQGHVTEACRGKLKSHKGFYWKYVDQAS